MKLLCVLHPSFFQAKDPSGEWGWLSRYTNSLREIGIETSLFEMQEHKIKDFDLIHFFSSDDPATWDWVQEVGIPVVVTPGLKGLRGFEQPKRGVFFLRLLRAMIQRRWPPVDQFTFYQCAKKYLIPSAWVRRVQKDWAVPSQKVILLPEDPLEAARVASQVYQSVLGASPPFC